MKSEKNKDEIDKYYKIRELYIDLSKPKNKKEYKLCEMYSHIFINMIFLKCRYFEDTEKVIKTFFEKNKDKFMKNLTF